jgi:hypothetical protein
MEHFEMNDRRHLLKIKLKSLAAEAKFIRREEHKRKLYSPLPDGEVVAQMMAAGDDKARSRWLRNWKRSKRAETRTKPWFNESQLQLSELQLHRVLVLRRASRAASLAYGFIRGRSLEQIEGKRKELEGRVHTLPGTELRVTLDEFKVFEEAAKITAKYGWLGTSKSDAQRDFYQWATSRNAKIVYESGWQRLDVASAPLSAPRDTGGTARLSQGTP